MALKDREEVIASLLEVTEKWSDKSQDEEYFICRPYSIKKNSSRVGG
jgi:hypothetical protein